LSEPAELQYKEALRVDKSFEPALIALGNLAFDRKDYRLAGRYYKKVLKRNPGHGGANNNMAMLLLAEGKKLDKAADFAKKAESSNFKPYALDTLARIYMKEGRPDLAKTALDDAQAAAAGDEGLLQQIQKTKQQLAGSNPS
jgi:tetratricopeptide (TPR) repeat protein